MSDGNANGGTLFDDGTQPDQWWYNYKTGQVEKGEQSLGSDRYGPYATRAEAENALEIAQERSRQWAEDDE